MADDALLDRVRKLLALATSPNVHEAAAAAARAQALIEKHRLEDWLRANTDPDLDPDPILDGWHTPLEVARRLRRWKVALATGLAEVNGCLAYTAIREMDEAIVLVGRGRDRDAVDALWGWLVPRIEWLSATHGPGRPRRWHEAFRVGAADAIVERLRAGRTEARADHGVQALTVVDDAAAHHRDRLERFADEHLRLGKGRALRVDGRAWAHGRTAADGLGLPDQGEN